MSVVVGEWRPAEACLLQQALRLTNEAFAARLGSAARTVAKWHANPAMRLTLEMQQALDTMLERATEDQRLRFTRLVAPPRENQPEHRERWRRRLNADGDVGSALDCVDGIRQEPPGTTRRDVEELLRDGGAERLQARVRARGTLDRAAVADIVRDFYGTSPAGFGTLVLTSPGSRQATTLLSRDAWLYPRLDLKSGSQGFQLDHGLPGAEVPPTPSLIQAATQRVAEILVARTRFVDAPVYRMVRRPGEGGVVGAQFALDTFARYGLTWNLLEAEVCDLALGSRDNLALRELLLPSAAAVLDPASRICVGGAQALCAFARPTEGDAPADYLLLVQERSPQVVNATGRLAAIPKCFHQPINDASRELGLGHTLMRELEEELFGRDELDAGRGGNTLADPMHPSRLTPPMRWLVGSERWGMEGTGFGFNLTTGNYEYAALIAVHDEDFWNRFGGTIETNWESSRLRTLSSRDGPGIAALMREPGWSDEGLVAFALGLKRLAELDPERVVLPPFEIGVET